MGSIIPLASTRPGLRHAQPPSTRIVVCRMRKRCRSKKPHPSQKPWFSGRGWVASPACTKSSSSPPVSVPRYLPRPRCANGLGVERGDGDLPGRRVHKLGGRKHALSDKPVNGTNANIETGGRCINTDRVSGSSRVERCDAQTLAEFAHTDRGPGLAIFRLAAHPVHRHGKLPIGPLASELTHDFDWVGPAIRRVTAGLDPCDPKLAMPATNPMNNDHCFVGRAVQIASSSGSNLCMANS